MSRSRIRYAHFPGQGPAGKTCRTCAHRYEIAGSVSVCRKAAELAGLSVEEVLPISRHGEACKYFQEATPCTSPA
jgi:hypothetical protein